MSPAETRTPRPRRSSTPRRSIEELKAATPPESWVRYEAVKVRLQACLDLFSARLSDLPKGKRFAPPIGRGPTMIDRVRNDMRTYAIGCFAALGREVGLTSVELYGEGKGRTLLTELYPLHAATVMSAMAKFDALLADGSEVSVIVAERFKVLVESARAEVERELERLKKSAA